MWRRGVAAMAACCLSMGALAACGSDEDGGGGAATAPTSSQSDAPSTPGIDQSAIDLGLKYTHGKAGEADASLAPVKVGFVNQEGSTPSFPDQTAVANATVRFINEELGGIGGHPLELDRCVVQSEEDGQKCAVQMLNDRVPLLNQGVLAFGAASLHKTIAGRIPTIMNSVGAPPDFTAKDAHTLTAGGAGLVNGMLARAKALGATNVALVNVDDPPGRNVTEQSLVPGLDALKIKHGKPVFFKGDATTPDIVSAMQAAGVSDADVLITFASGPGNCVSLYDGLKQLGVKLKVIANMFCNDNTFVDHADGAPEGWEIAQFNVNPRTEGNPDSDAYNTVMAAYGATRLQNSGLAPLAWTHMLTIAGWANTVGADNLTPEALSAQAKAFKGPAPMIPGDIDCATSPIPAMPVLCANAVGVSANENGAWTEVGAFKIPGS
jgi:branched-chain amino acid transport system substrate-binding protein